MRMTKEPKKDELKCLICGTLFTSRSAVNVYCNDMCRKKSYKLRQKRIDINCLSCGALFTPKSAVNVYCNAMCGERYRVPRDKQRRRLNFSTPEGKERARKWSRKQELKAVGWTLEEYNTVLYAQGGLCFICGQSNFERGHNVKLAADHNHETGVRRALLCRRCNQGIGLFEDSIGILIQAASYLGRFK